jgi:hypothetical protein
MDNSLIDAPFIPVWARSFNEPLFFIYNGPSMAPLFKPGDLLCARSSFLKSIRRGDVVIYSWRDNPNHLNQVVHRVVSVKGKLLKTQGDNNLKPDSQVILVDNLVGLVTSFGRQKHIYSVKGGILGSFYAQLIRSRNNIRLLGKRLGWRIYRQLHQSGIVARFWQPEISQIRVLTNEGPLIKYCFHSKTIARWWPHMKRFLVVKPFDLVIFHPYEQSQKTILD